MKYHRPSIYFTTGLAILVGCAGCKDKQEIKVYRVSKAESEAFPMASSASEATPATPGSTQPGIGSEPAPELTGTAPSNWEVQVPSSMRQASFLVKGADGASADVSLVVLGGSAGSTLANVNRWLTQLGQPEINEVKLQEIAQHTASALGDVTIVDLEGLPQGADAAKDGRILAGIAFGDGQTYFFKMRGNAALVESQKDGFTKWVSSVHSASASMSASPEPAHAAAQAAEPAAESKSSQVKWEDPEGWKSTPPSSMRYASFAVAGPNGEAGDVSVSMLPGDSGGDLANVNRWRGQIGLEAVADGALESLITKVGAGDGGIKMVNLAGQKSSLLAGWTRNSGSTWFFKLTGPGALVGGEKEKFLKFLQSVQFTP